MSKPLISKMLLVDIWYDVSTMITSISMFMTSILETLNIWHNMQLCELWCWLTSIPTLKFEMLISKRFNIGTQYRSSKRQYQPYFFLDTLILKLAVSISNVLHTISKKPGVEKFQMVCTLCTIIPVMYWYVLVCTDHGPVCTYQIPWSCSTGHDSRCDISCSATCT